MVDLTEREIERRVDWAIGRSLEKKDAEILRLQDAKRRALAIADERSKENVELRAEIVRLRAGILEACCSRAAYRNEICEECSCLAGKVLGSTSEQSQEKP